MTRTRVLIVDDHPLFRAGVRSGLGAYPDLQVIGEAVCGHAALEVADTALPEVVLIDTQLAPTARSSYQQLKRRHPQMLVVMMTRIEDDEQLVSSD